MNQSESNLATTILDLGVFDHAAIGIAYLNSNGNIQRSNKILQELLGYSGEDLTSLQLEDIVHPDDRSRLQPALNEIRTQFCNQDLELRCFDANGNIVTLRFLMSPFGTKYNSTPYVIALIEKVQNSINNSEELSFDRKLFETIAEHVPTTVWLTSLDLKELHYVNQAFMDIWGVDKEQVAKGEANNLLKRIHPDDMEKVQHLIDNGFGDKESYVQNFRLLHDDGSISYLEDRGTILRDENNKARFILGTHLDMTERVRYTSQLETLNQELQDAYEEVTRLNQFDTLTGAYNRKAMLNQLSNSYYQFTRYEIPASVIYIDLNNFKQVNDEHGHLAGDLVLKNFVITMRERLRQTDIFGRMGGDEFLLLLPGTSKKKAEQFLVKEQQYFDTKIKDKMVLRLNYSTGISEINFKIDSVDDWIDAADKAMYKDKKSS